MQHRFSTGESAVCSWSAPVPHRGHEGTGKPSPRDPDLVWKNSGLESRIDWKAAGKGPASRQEAHFLTPPLPLNSCVTPWSCWKATSAESLWWCYYCGLDMFQPVGWATFANTDILEQKQDGEKRCELSPDIVNLECFRRSQYRAAWGNQLQMQREQETTLLGSVDLPGVMEIKRFF